VRVPCLGSLGDNDERNCREFLEVHYSKVPLGGATRRPTPDAELPALSAGVVRPRGKAGTDLDALGVRYSAPRPRAGRTGVVREGTQMIEANGHGWRDSEDAGTGTPRSTERVSLGRAAASRSYYRLLLAWIALLALGCGSASQHTGGSGGQPSSSGGTGRDSASPVGQPFVCAAGTWAATAKNQAECQAWTDCRAGQFVQVDGHQLATAIVPPVPAARFQ
jgi:hypothetical protein